LIKKVWTRILGENISLIHSVDQRTVELVQLRAPCISKMDAGFIKQNMLSQELFPEIKDPAIRAEIERRLLEIEQPIPSIFTLFKDLRYLDPAARAVNFAFSFLKRSLAILLRYKTARYRTQQSLGISMICLILPFVNYFYVLRDTSPIHQTSLLKRI